jgi:DNA repair exonuclease SbcCD nuclease subunit
MTYVVLSDIHAHNWSLFAATNPDGVNTRLRIILNEIERAADALIAKGGHRMIIAGDIFHTRGVMDPEVLNPVRETFDRVIEKGIEVFAIPGNHDLKSRDTIELSSAIQNLEQVGLTGGSFRVMNEPSIHQTPYFNLCFVPWRNTTEELLRDLGNLAKEPIVLAKTDVFIHAGIDGVLSGHSATGSGLTVADLAKFGFRHVFAGHYHNHAVLGSGVVSIGATTHHNWGDVGTRAGFLMVDGLHGTVQFNDTQAPKFVDISGQTEEDMELMSIGNYVRFRGPQMTNEQINEFRDQLKKWGALGTSIEVPRVSAVTRTTAPVKGLSIKESIDKYVTDATVPAHLTKQEILKKAQEVFYLSQAVVEES